MKDKSEYLVSINLLVKNSLATEGLESDALSELEYALEEACKNVVSKLEVQWDSTSTILLEPGVANCQKCNACGCWITDESKEKPVSQLPNGMSNSDGEVFCPECFEFK